MRMFYSWAVGAFGSWVLHTVLWLNILVFSYGEQPSTVNQTCSASTCQQSRITASTESASARHLTQIQTGYIISGTTHSRYAESTQDGGVAVSAMLYTAEEDVIITGGQSGNVQFWKGKDPAEKSTDTTDTALYELNAQTAAGAPVTALAYIPGDQSIAVAREDGFIRFLRLNDRGILGEIQENNRQGLITAIEHLEYHDDVLNYVEVASASTSSSIKLWDVQTRSLSRTFTGHKRPVLALRFLPPLEMLVSGGFDGLVCFWSLPVAKRLAVGKRCIGQKTYLSTAYREMDCLASTISQGGTYFIYGLQDTSAANSCEMELTDCSERQDAEYALFEIENPSRFKLPGHEGAVRAIEWVSDSKLVASGGDDGKVQIWDPEKGGNPKRTLQVQGQGERVIALLYISALRVLVAGTTAGVVFFDPQKEGSALKTVSLQNQVNSLDYLGSHQLIATMQSEWFDLLNALEICVDGKQRKSAAECEFCPVNYAGKNGICKERCRSGESSSENRTLCVDCQPGSGGVDGFCELCQPGRYQDKSGRLSCTPCPKGYAQPSPGKTKCAACYDNTVSESDGQAQCVECPDGKEPCCDQTRCQACPDGRAGTRGLCFDCKDGQQPNILASACVPCPAGMAGTKGSCTRCPDGMQPAAGLTECEPCPVGEAGRKGMCKQCIPGQTPEPGSAFCMNCPPGEAGTNGTCSPCSAGFVPIPDRTACEECPDKQPSSRGECTPCLDGTEPAENRTLCLPCPRGEAGKGGICEPCGSGHEASEDKSGCVKCDEISASYDGICNQCGDGTQPNRNRTKCDPCEPGFAGRSGRCEACGDGMQQDENRSGCEGCPLGKAGSRGICQECSHPLLQNEERTECNLRPLPPYFVFFNPRCSGHPQCRDNFAHIEGDYFCCPTKDGDNLDCCQFETEMSKKGWQRLTSVIEMLVVLLTDSMWLPPVLGIAFLVPTSIFLYRVKTHEDWEDWREHVRTTRCTVIWVIVCLPVLAAIMPWALLTTICLGWSLVLAMFIYAQFFKFVLRSTAYLHYERPTAVQRMRKWWGFLFAVKFSTDTIEFVHDWLLLHALWMSMVGFLFGGNKPIAFEQVVDTLGLPWAMQSGLNWMLYTLRGPQVMMSSILVHIAIHTDNFTVVLFAAASFVWSLACGTYILLAGDVFGRLTAAKQGIALAHISPKSKIQMMAIYGCIDWFFTLYLSWSGLASATVVPQLLMLAPDGKVDSNPFDGPAQSSAWLYVLMVQVGVLGIWICIAGGAHVDDPPQLVARWMQRWSGVQLQALRREQFVIRAVLRGLGFQEPEREDALDDSVIGSPTGSPTGSPRSPSTSPRSMSPKGDRSPRSLASSGNSKEAEAQAKKVLKNFGSVRRLLRQLDPTLEDDPSEAAVSELGITAAAVKSPQSSPRSERSSRRLSTNNALARRPSRINVPGPGSSPRSPVDSARGNRMPAADRLGNNGKPIKLASEMGSNSCRKPVNFVRLPDGSHAPLNQGGRRVGSENTSPRQSRSPGRSTSGLFANSPLGRTSSFGASPQGSGRASIAQNRSGRHSFVSGGGSGGTSPVGLSSGRVSVGGSGAGSPSGMIGRNSTAGSGLGSPTGMPSGRISSKGSFSRRSFSASSSPRTGDSTPTLGRRMSSRSKSLIDIDMYEEEKPPRCGPFGRCWRRCSRGCQNRFPRTVGLFAKARKRLCSRCVRNRELDENGVAKVRMKVSYDPRKEKEILSLENWDLNESQGTSSANLEEFVLTPQQLYEKIPKPQVVVSCKRLLMNIRRSLRCCWSVCMGQWKEGWNIKALRLRLRVRDYAKEVWRKSYDQRDYNVMEWATARTVASATLGLPGGALLWATAMYLNRPAFRHYDDSMDIIQHKVEEYVDRGTSHKQAMIIIMKKLIRKPEHRWKKAWTLRCVRIVFLLNVTLLFCLITMACAVTGENAFWLLPQCSVLVIGSLIARTVIEQLVMPALMLPSTTTISVRRELDDEKYIMSQVREAIGSEESSTTEDSLSDYSSANESFLDEDPRSTNLPSVLGVKNAKIIVRPKACRLHMRFKLQQCIPDYGAHLRRWKREDPLKHCPLLQVPGAYAEQSERWNNCGGYALRRERSVAFQPTEGSDWPMKVQKFGLRRCNTLSTISAREDYMWRQQHERWDGWFDIFEEKALKGLPRLPKTKMKMPDRGLVDQFEEQTVFRPNEQELTNKQIFCANPFTDTRLGKTMTRATHFVLGRPAPARPKWEMSYDEELARSTDSVAQFIDAEGLREILDSARKQKDAEAAGADNTSLRNAGSAESRKKGGKADPPSAPPQKVDKTIIEQVEDTAEGDE